MFRVALALLFLFGVYCAAQQKPCPKSDQLRVEKEAVTLRSWDDLYKSYLRYKHCDDVDAQEGYSESIARILADHWDTLPRLAQLIRKNTSFGSFVVLNATMNMDDVAKIRANAVEHCPTGLGKLCAKLKKDADEAIAEDASAKKQSN